MTSTTTTLPARRIEMDQPIANAGNLKSVLEAAKSSIAAVAPKHLTAERLMKMALIAASRQPKLLQCTASSILQAVMRASELGLDCSGTLGDGYLVPFKRNIKVGNAWRAILEAQFICGYRGLINLARRSGSIQSIEAHVVHELDQALVDFGRPVPIEHRPKLSGDRGKLAWCYAQAWLLGSNRPQVEVMTLQEIESIRRQSKTYDPKTGKNDGPWGNPEHYSEMARKTVVRRLCKYLPLSPEIESALQAEADREGADAVSAAVMNSGAAFVEAHPTDPSRQIDRADSGEPHPEEEVARTIEGPELADSPSVPAEGIQDEPTVDPLIGEEGAARLIDALATKSKCLQAVAGSALRRYVGDNFQNDLAGLTSSQSDQVLASIKSGKLTVPK